MSTVLGTPAQLHIHAVIYMPIMWQQHVELAFFFTVFTDFTFAHFTTLTFSSG